MQPYESHRKGIGTVQCSESGQDKLKSGSSKSRKKTCVFYDTFIYGSLEIGNLNITRFERFNGCTKNLSYTWNITFTNADFLELIYMVWPIHPSYL